MIWLRYWFTALAAQLPCRVEPEPAPMPSFCDCGERFAAKARAWDEGLLRHHKRVGALFYSPQIGHA